MGKRARGRNKRNKQAQAELTALKDRLANELADMERLHTLSARLMQQDDLTAVLHEVLVAAATLLHVGKASVQIRDSEDHALRLVSTIGFDQDPVDPATLTNADGSTVCTAALHRDERVIAEELAMQPGFTELTQAAPPYGIRAVQSMPFRGGDSRIHGMLTLYFDRPYHPSARERRLLDLYVQQAVRQIERKQAEAALRENEQHLRVLSESLERRVEARTAELQRQAVRLRRLAGELTSAEQRERKHLAALLHDDLQQLLAAAKMRLGQTRTHIYDPTVQSMIEGVTDLLDQAVDSLRNLTRQLWPAVLYESGLIAALEWLAPELSKLHDLRIALDIEDAEPSLGDEAKALLFGAVRELLFNAVKHSGVKEATVRMRQSEQGLQIAVEDKGVGFDVDALGGNRRTRSSSASGCSASASASRHWVGAWTWNRPQAREHAFG